MFKYVKGLLKREPAEVVDLGFFRFKLKHKSSGHEEREALVGKAMVEIIHGCAVDEGFESITRHNEFRHGGATYEWSVTSTVRRIE